MDASTDPKTTEELAPQPRDNVVAEERKDNPNARPVFVFEVTAFLNHTDPAQAELSVFTLGNYTPLTDRYTPQEVAFIMRKMLPQVMQTISQSLQNVLEQTAAKELAAYLAMALAAVPPADEPTAAEPDC